MNSKDLRDSVFCRVPVVALYAGVLVGGLSLGVGCSDDTDTGAKEGESCATSSDCKKELVCRNDQCVTPTVIDEDATSDDTETPDGSDEPDVEEPEEIDAADYYISYLLEDQLEETEFLHVLSTEDGTDHQISDADHPCDRGCWLTEDMSYFAWAEVDPDSTAGLNIFAVEVVDFVLQGDGEQVASGALSISAAGNGITYRRDGTSYYLPLSSGGEEREIAGLAGDGPMGGWYVDPGADVAFAFSPTLDSLELKVGTFEDLAFDSVFTLNAVNYAGGAGSYYGSTMPVAVSPDGTLLAFITKAPNDYRECGTAQDCPGPVKICGANNFCSVLEITANFLDLENVDKLGGECSTSEDCGGVHQCYQPGPAADATCIPGRVALGLPDTPYQRANPGDTPRSGCELSKDDATYEYTQFEAPISFDNDGNLYGAARRDCVSEGTVGDSDIIKINPRTKEYGVVWGNSSTGFDPSKCWDADNQVVDISECEPYISAAVVSPDGNDIAFSATNPNIDNEDFGKRNLDIWSVLRNGEEHDWVGGHNVFQTVDRIAVHPKP